MSSTDQKIDELARMVAQGFSEIREEMATKGDLLQLREEMATKEDLKNLRAEIVIMLDKFLGTVRKDYDELATRTRTLEDRILYNP